MGTRKTFFDPRALIASVHENRLTALYVTPSILGACVQSCSPAQLETELASLRVVWLTGEQVTPKLREQVAQLLPWVRIRNIYSTNESGDVAVADSDNCFKSLDGVHIEVLDPESLQPVPEGEVGALHVRSRGLDVVHWVGAPREAAGRLAKVDGAVEQPAATRELR